MVERTSINESLRVLEKSASRSDHATEMIERTSLQPFPEDIKRRARLAEQLRTAVESASFQVPLPDIPSIRAAQMELSKEGLTAYRLAMQ